MGGAGLFGLDAGDMCLLLDAVYSLAQYETYGGVVLVIRLL